MWLAGLAKFYDILMDKGFISRNPFKSPLIALPRGSKEPRQPAPDMGETNARKLLNVCVTPHDRALMSLLLGCGLRKSEVLGLKREHCCVYAATPIIYLHNTKAGGSQKQSLPSWVATELGNYNRFASNGPLFNLSSASLHRWFNKKLYEADIYGNRYTIHSCRVTAINTLLRAGYSHKQVRDFARHKSVTTTERYERRLNSPAENVGLHLKY